MTLDRYVDSLPNLSDHKRRFLKANSEMLNGERFDVMSRAYKEAMQAGFEDDTEALDRFLVETVRDEMAARHGRLAEAARSAIRSPPRLHNDSVEQAAARLGAEVNALQSVDIARESAPDIIAAQLPQPEPVPRSRSMPMTAPVSRDVPMLSGQRPMSSGVTLTAEERFIARHSFSDPNMTDAQKEASYAAQKRRLAALRSQGLYPDRERG
jgi:hypothetical protein